MTRTRRHAHLPFVVCLLLCYSDAQRVFRIDPHIGSINGATRITIKGEGFAQENQFSLNPEDADFGNSVTLVSKTRSIPCDVERDSTHANQILCYTRAMPHDNYYIRVSVDGEPIPNSRMCNGWYNHHICSFFPRWYRTPTLKALSPSTGLPGSLISIKGRTFTDVYGSNTATSTNGLNVRFLRAYMGGMPCDLLKPNSDELYGLRLDSERSWNGKMNCTMTGTYVGHHNLSYILDSEFGRSLPENKVYFVSGLNKLSMFQTYAEVTGVSPSEGSVLGGTLMTIHGRHFDETDKPATVLVGGQECKVVSVADDMIVCRTPEHPQTNTTLFPGGRGLKMELWNASSPSDLEDVLDYTSSRPDYSAGWLDSLTHRYPDEIPSFVSKLSGFFVPMETDHYRFFIKGDDKYHLYFSLTGNPEDKELIASRNGVTNSFFSSGSQASSVMHLEKGKAYYLDALLQDRGGPGWVQVGVYKWKSPFTHEQAEEAVNEKQILYARYSVLQEKQVLRFDGWGSVKTPVKEVQQVTVSSNCFSLGTCAFTFYTLSYGEHQTGPVAVSASADDVATALNGLWTIKPDSVTVTKQDLGTAAQYTVTFNSRRGDFESLDSWSMGSDLNVSVTEVTKGVASLETFTVLWGGIPSSPIPFNATESEVQSAIEAMVSAECPAEVLSMETSAVKYHRDYEDEDHTGFSGDLDRRGTRVQDTDAFCGRWSLMNPEILFLESDTKESGGTYKDVNLQQHGTLCFAYKGGLKREVGVKFSYKNSQGATKTETAQVPLPADQDSGWHYTCVDLMSFLQNEYFGSNYLMSELHLSKDAEGEDYYVDAVHLGRSATVFDNSALHKRRPPALARWGHIIDSVSVAKTTEGSRVSYEISASPFNCAYNLPLLEVGFLQEISSDLTDSQDFTDGGANVTVIRTQMASPPLQGTFDMEIYGQRVEGLAVDISADDLKYALQGIPEMGLLAVKRLGDCKGLTWVITWLGNPGRQPLLQVNGSGVIGVDPRVYVHVRDEGGLFMQSIRGDLLRVPESKPQVAVLINGIPSKCSGNCGFEWSEDKTPLVTGISPSQGSNSLGTVLTVSGSGFDGHNATVWIGHTECFVIQVTDTQVTCSVGPAAAGTYPVILSIPSLGYARYQGNEPFNFTSQLTVSSVSPTSGSVTGGTVLTVMGYGFSPDTEVMIGSEMCEVLAVDLSMLQCRTPAGSVGSQPITVRMGEMSEEAGQSFTYSDGLTATITSISPQTTTVSGHRLLVVLGTNFGVQGNDSLVFVGQVACVIVEWNATAITCVLPSRPPAVYGVNVQVGNMGSPKISAGVTAAVEYVLEVSGVTPLRGSLYGGSRLTIAGSGFSSNPGENSVMLGDRRCEVTVASWHQIQCVVESGVKTHTVTNQGSHPSHGEGYAWSPAAVLATVGDTVVWRWEAPAFIQGVGYRVFSVANPSSTTPDGLAFTSGDTKTPTGFFRYQFTSPGVYYYSSGFVDDNNQKSLQGSVTVRGVEDSSIELHVAVGDFAALIRPARSRVSRSVEDSSNVTPSGDASSSNVTSSGDASASSNMTSSGDAASSNVTSSGDASASSNGTSSNMTSSGETAPSNGTSSNMTSSGDASASSNGTSPNVTSSGDTASSNVTPSGDASASSNVTSSGGAASSNVTSSNVTPSGVASASSNVTHSGDTASSNGTSSNGTSSNVTPSGGATSSNVTHSGDTASSNGTSSNVTPSGDASASSNVTSSGGAASSNVTPSGDASASSNVTSSGDTATSNWTSSNVTPSGDASASSNETSSNMTSSGGATSSNVTPSGDASASSNGTSSNVTPSGGATSSNVTPSGDTSASSNGTSSLECVPSPPDCPSSTPSGGTGLSFSFSSCASPAVHAISPASGHALDFIRIQGMGFGTQSCAIEVLVGDHPCQVANATVTEIFCQLSTDSGADIGIPLPVSVRVSNLGTAINTAPSEIDRRFVVLPVVDSVSPSSGSDTGFTKLTVTGSGFSENVAVTVAGLPCDIMWANYTMVVCNTAPSPTATRSGPAVVHVGSIATSCQGDCTFTYSASLAPNVFGVHPDTVTGNLTSVVINGTGFGSDVNDVSVHAGGISLEVAEVTDTTITLSVGPLPGGSHPLRVVVMSRGLAQGDGATLSSDARATLSPGAGSTAGGTPLVLTGNGFLPGETSVSLDGAPCWITEVMPGEVRCLTPPHDAAVVEVVVEVLEVQYPVLTFNYSQAHTPEVTDVNPATGLSNTVITLTGTGFGFDASLISVEIDGVACNVATVTDTQVTCAVGEHAGGTFPIMLQHKLKGYATSEEVFNYELQLSGVVPSEGGVGGGNVVSVEGTGFEPSSSQVWICESECEVHRDTSTSTHLYCQVPPANGSDAEQLCPVTVMNGKDSVNISNGYSYKSALTPAVTEVTPRRGGTAGGTRLTITGSNFSTNSSEVSVTIAGSVCDVQSANQTHIVCVTNSQPRSQETKVRVQIGDRGTALMDHADFFYIDVWSSRYTWGGLSPPEKGSFAVITKGQTILLDASTPVLKMLLIQGGKLVFDEKDIELQAENILIVDGGALQIGTEEEPFQHKAIITLHGHLRSPELPVYGAKTLGVREGVLDLHGIPIPVTWTRLAQTSGSGSPTLVLTHPVTWRSGDQVVIATTGHRHSQIENEVRIISSVSSDGRTLTLTEPLEYTHLGVSVTLPDGTEFEARAEVGLLTRNIVVRGSINAEWSDKVEACPDGFDTGEFSTQTCFQGRFGEETGSDQFGGCIMFHAPRPGENLAIGRIEHVEMFNAGQAFRLGRYPIHWHLMGDVNFKSYVRGCSLHQTFNRAVTIHNTHRLLVERNVIYNIMGGAFFIEDGIETGNVLQYNLAVFVKQSTSLLNDDVTPAAYWVTNPNNVIRHNAAAGGTHFGFWYRMHKNPDGPSYDPNICQQRVPLGEFANNTVHSQGWFGLWIFKEYYPVKDGSCRSSRPEPAVFRTLTTWNCEKGAEWVDVGAVQFNGFVMVNNEKAGIEGKRIISNYVRDFSEEAGAAVVNSTMVGYLDELLLGDDYCSTRGVILPLDDGMSVNSSTFMNFDRPGCTAIGVAKIDGTCIERCGGWGARFSGIQYYNSPNKAGFRWEHEVNLIDLDGSLTGSVGSKVVPASPLLDPALCTSHADWSVGFPGVICDPSVSFHRLSFNHPTPTSLESNLAIFSNDFGASEVPYMKKRMTHKFGWMAMLQSGQTYRWHFDGVAQVTNVSYDSTFYGFKRDEFIIINHNLTQSPDSFFIMDKRNGSTSPLTNDDNVNGDWYMDKNTNNLYYLVSGKDTNSRRRRRSSADPETVDRDVDFAVSSCFYPNCQPPPPPPPATLAPLPSRRPDDFITWSSESFWRSSAENNFTVPREGSDVVIPIGSWMVLDEDTPPLNKLTVLGVLEVPNDMNTTSSRRRRTTANKIVLDATYISIQGGRLIAGWEDEPFSGELHIVLRGTHYTPEWLLPMGPNQGSKVLGVFGILDLYGKPHDIYHTKLASTASAGTATLTLRQAVDWQAGDEVVISTTSYDPWQTEKRTISAVSDDRRTLTLSELLTHTHIGETYSISGSSRTYTLAADVGLLTRNIKIIGHAHPELYSQSFGARLLVGTFSEGGIDYRGKAQIRNVEFYHTGQEGWSDSYDPRYSVAFVNLGEVPEMESYIQGCGFHDGFSPAIGVFGTDGLTVDDNVIYFTVGQGIRVWGSTNLIRRNLVTMTLWPGSYQGREEKFNYDWTAAIEVNEGTNTVLIGNIVAGYERSGYLIDGEPCPGTVNPVQAWQDNEAHGGIYGIMMNKDGLPGCSHIQGFTVWRSFDFGIYFQVSMNIQISNITLVDNGMGIMSIIYSPPSLQHLYADKTVHIQNALIVGSSPDFNCSDKLSSTETYVQLSREHKAPRPPMGGRSGICWPAFISGHNAGPTMSLTGSTSYNTIKGLMTVTDTTFVAFRDVCSTERAVMFLTNPGNEDLQHPVQVKRITQAESTEGGRLLIHRPNLGKVNPSDCVDMDCDAKKKSLLRDEDGTFLGAVGTVVPHAEFEWDGDARHGVGDYRIPKVMLSYPNGSRIPVSQIAPRKGLIRDSTCVYVSEWQSYKCFGLNYRMLAIESLDADTETRRLSPVAVLGDGYIDLINGPQDHGWCNGYTCQKRLSLFHSIIATNKAFDVYFTGISPQKLRLMMLNAKPTETVRVAVFYSSPGRLDVYVNNELVAPTNAEWNSDNTDYTLKEPTSPGMYVPALDSTTNGANFFDPEYKMLHVVLRGSEPVEVRTSPKLFVSFSLPAMTEDEFFGENLVNNLAAFLKVPASMIRITKIVREGGDARRRKRSTGLSVEVEISKPPVQQTTNTTNDEEAFSELQNLADDLGQAAISGNLSQATGFNVSSMGVIPPPPPSSDPTWNEVATAEVTREDPVPEKVTSLDSLSVMQEPVAGLTPGPLSQQPSIMALDQEGSCVAVGVTTLTLTAVLKDSSGTPVDGLYGNTTILFKGCWANYTDLSISVPGDNMTLAFILKEVSASSRSFTIRVVSVTTSSPFTNTTYTATTSTSGGPTPSDSPIPPDNPEPTTTTTTSTSTTTTNNNTTTTTLSSTTEESTTEDSTTDSDYPSVLDGAVAPSSGSLVLLLTLLFGLLFTLSTL